MKNLNPSALTVIAGQQVALVQLVLMQFPGLTLALNSSNIDIVWEGVTYRGAYGLGSVSVIEDSPGEVKGLQLTLSGVSSENISLAMDDAAIVQGTPLTIRTAILHPNSYAVLDAPIDWRGRLDTMGIGEDGETCTISATAESSAVDLLSRTALTYSDADQQFLYPGDLAFQYITANPNTPVVWPTKQWFIATGGR